MPDKHFLIKIKCRFNAGGCVDVCPLCPPPDIFFSSGAEIYYLKFQGGMFNVYRGAYVLNQQGHISPMAHGSTRRASVEGVRTIFELTFFIKQVYLTVRNKGDLDNDIIYKKPQTQLYKAIYSRRYKHLVYFANYF